MMNLAHQTETHIEYYLKKNYFREIRRQKDSIKSELLYFIFLFSQVVCSLGFVMH